MGLAHPDHDWYRRPGLHRQPRGQSPVPSASRCESNGPDADPEVHNGSLHRHSSARVGHVKWGHTITYNEATKVTSIQSCPVTGHLAGQQSFTNCLNGLNAHAQQAGYDRIVPVSGPCYVYLGRAEIELPNSVMEFTIQVDMSLSPAQRRALIRDAVAFLAQIRRGAAGR